MAYLICHNSITHIESSLDNLNFLIDPPEGKTVDHTTVDEFKNLLNLNLVNYFIFCKVSVSQET